MENNLLNDNSLNENVETNEDIALEQDIVSNDEDERLPRFARNDREVGSNNREDGNNNKETKGIEYDYKPDSKYEKYYNEDKETQNNLKQFNKLAQDNNFTKEQHKAIVDFMNGILEKVGVFDTRSETEIKVDNENWIKEEKAKLGKDADNIINSNVELVNNFGMFNEEQKKELLNFMGKGALSCSIVNIIKNCLLGGTSKNIPTDLNIGGLPDDYTLAKEYNNPNTTEKRREEIIKQRIEAGRNGFLPIVD